MNSHSKERGRLGAPGRVLVIMAVTALAIVTIAWAVGLFDVETYGRIDAPNVAVTGVAVSGGEVPGVPVELVDIDVGSRTRKVDVPAISVTPASDDRRDRN